MRGPRGPTCRTGYRVQPVTARLAASVPTPDPRAGTRSGRASCLGFENEEGGREPRFFVSLRGLRDFARHVAPPPKRGQCQERRDDGEHAKGKRRVDGEK